MTIESQANDAIEKYVYSMLTKRQRIAINVCNSDLYHGPFYGAGGQWRYATWLPIAESVLDSIPNELWYDIQSGQVLESEPQGWFENEDGDILENGEDDQYIEPFWEDYYHFKTTSIKKIIYGELANYI